MEGKLSLPDPRASIVVRQCQLVACDRRFSSVRPVQADAQHAPAMILTALPWPTISVIGHANTMVVAKAADQSASAEPGLSAACIHAHARAEG